MTEVITHRFVHDFIAPATTKGKSAKHAHFVDPNRAAVIVPYRVGPWTVGSGVDRAPRCPGGGRGVGAHPAPLRARRASQVAPRPRRRPTTPNDFPTTGPPRRRGRRCVPPARTAGPDPS